MAKNKQNQPSPRSGRRKKRNLRLRRATIPLAAFPGQLREHLQCLGLDSVEAYLDWCRQNGLPCGVYKSREQMQKERDRAVCNTVAREARAVRRPQRVLSRMLEGNGATGEVPRSLLFVQGLLRTASAQGDLARRVLRRVLEACPDILFERVGAGAAAEEIYLQALVRLTEHAGQVGRDVETWRPRSYNSRRRFGSLARHLFARFEVPVFMDSAWFDSDPRAVQHRQWFVHIGAGNNVRTASALPLVLTRRMAHWFLRAPDDDSVLEALRFGQVLGLGGDPRLADALRGTRLCRDFRHDEFWVSVLRFFIRNPMLDTVHVGPILDYLHHQRFEPRQVVGADGRVQQEPPPQPNLSMQGRNAATLLRQVQDWHGYLTRGPEANVIWRASGIPEFRSVQGDGRGGNQSIWTIRELTAGVQLQAEGRKMRHCVASYVHSCRTGRTSIWSMEVQTNKGRLKVLTIEVDARQRRIIQARGRDNARPTELGRKVMARWAAEAQLTIPSWV